MASDNNNINSLAAEAADETTSELEVLSVDLIPTEEELEMDINTFSLDEDDADGSNVASLQSDLRSKDERISNLQYDIEQLRARWTGLEKEISAREELTEILQADLKTAHKSLTSKDKQLSRNERDLAALRTELDAAKKERGDALERASELERSVTELNKTAEENAERITTLESKLTAAENALPPPDDERDQLIADGRLAISELNAYIDGRSADWSRQNEQIEILTSTVADHEQRAAAQSERLTANEAKVDALVDERNRLQETIDDARAQIRTLRKGVNDRQKEIDRYRQGEQAADQELIAKQNGILAENRLHVTILKNQAARSAEYADELREKLSDLIEKSKTGNDRQDRLEHDLATAKREIQKLEKQFEAEQDRAAQLQTQNRKLKEDFDSEVRKLRFELVEAQETIVDHESVNEQLTSDLIDNKSFKQALENQLSSASEAHETELKSLQKSIRKLETQLEENERKIENKDSAISALLNELANKSKTLESIDEIENVIHEIDDRMSERIEDRAVVDRDRPTRLLTGNIDGQELRFPLFKDRLTIGRTVQNDIQLRAQHISRRHAVIVTDEEGTKIVDWGSKNGVYVNNARISEQMLSGGDKVTIGTAEFLYEELQKRPTD